MGVPLNHPAILQAIERGLISPAGLVPRPPVCAADLSAVAPTVFVPPVAPDASEKDFQAAVMKLADANGWIAYHTHNSRRSNKGFPDVVAVRGPKLIFAELKSATGTFTTDQKLWLAALEAVPGVRVFRWRPSDWPEIVAILRGGRD